ncbi:hypothetical protein [Pseudonocardia asaccharolytica]|uniref:Uncharacterized protein n=1 Tax=Pseudonocardia asaccharolytica DSM 44247 = NBRC 16224 TaxID=1123024 RepID=A0A511D2L6_9PSEU|nr:hypothetical protein [Pseudonocardia asaccharolytica]GEL19021.1 hypothetical protein PA7_28580 [Pseudonocardia asaccharolytica DSM 44247 = NBRC 16224]
MSDALSIAELDSQHVELLPARTTMIVGVGVGGDGGRGGDALAINAGNVNFALSVFGDAEANQINEAIAVGGNGGNGGWAVGNLFD